MQIDGIPKVFISYSWSSDDTVLPLAERLVSHGVDVVLDKWDLTEGQDKYAFMERCVNDPNINKVLIVSDKVYAEKADSRTGGVGDETVIISGEIYGKMTQEKFIPIVAERDENGEAYMPAYIKTRIYVDLSDENRYEEEYEKLLRNIYDKPIYSKPKLGEKPNWLEGDKATFFPLKDLIKQIKGATTTKKQESCINKFLDMYVETLRSSCKYNTVNGEEVYNSYKDTKEVRDIFLDFLEVLTETETDYAEVLCLALEKFHNSLTCARAFNPDAMSARDNDYDVFKIVIWELFICIVAYFRHIQDYKTINKLLQNTYFLTRSVLDDTLVATNYCKFRHYSHLVEGVYKSNTEHSNKFTLLGHTICTEREKLPIFTKELMAETDLFLYQVCKGFDLTKDKDDWRDPEWFPTLYVYTHKCPIEWKKIVSKKFCEKMMLLFDVDTIDNLKERLASCEHEREMRYSGSFDSAMNILDYIKIEDIGSVN